MEGKCRYIGLLYISIYIHFRYPLFRSCIYLSFFCCRMEGKAEYNLPSALETKYVGDMKDGM